LREREFVGLAGVTFRFVELLQFERTATEPTERFEHLRRDAA
jgi:hypothetical protein